MNDKKFGLLTDGDDFEKVHYPKVEKYFPNYELFWKKYIYKYREEGSIQIREDVPELTVIFRYSYSIFFNLMKANLFGYKLEEQKYSFENRHFDDFIIYLSASLELTEKLLLFLYIFENSFNKKGNIEQDKIEKFAADLAQNIINKIEEKINNKELYKDIKENTLRFILQCNRNSVPIGNLDNINQLTTTISPFFESKGKKLKRDFYRLKNEVTTYRNLIVHEVKNYLYRNNDDLYIPKPGKLKIYSKTKIKITNKELYDDFYSVKKLIKGQFILSSSVLNRIWGVFLIELFERNKNVRNFYKSNIKIKKEINKESIYQTISTISPIFLASDVVPFIIEGVSYSINEIDNKKNERKHNRRKF